ncbi:MAG: PQQ-binding-like beta-propeller repeat protein [Kiritimatiellaeota bacterium]|nr:PQQ-binding-like beta-propeller repeat protein [Kiritimatiellota bacterium]
MKKTVLKGIVGIAALALLVVAGLRIADQVRRDRHRGPGGVFSRGRPGERGRGTTPARRGVWRALVRPVPKAATPRPAPDRVVGWWVETQPVLVAAECPRMTQTAKIQYRATPGLPKLAPAVALHITVLVEGPPTTRRYATSGQGNPPALWPGLQCLELLRADAPGSPFRVVQTLSKMRLDGLRTGSGSPSTGTSLYRYDFRLLDPGAPPGRLMRYKVRFVASEAPGAVPTESGVCTAVAFDLPRATLVQAAGQRPFLQWPSRSNAIPALLEQPKIVVGTTRAIYGAGIVRGTGFTELGRAPFAKGRVELPTETVNPGFLAQLGYAVEGVWAAKAWSSFEGAFTLSERTALCRPVTEHGPTVKLPLCRRTGESFVFCPRKLYNTLPAGGRLPDNPGIDIAASLHSRPSPGSKLRVRTADGVSPFELAADRNGRWTIGPGPAAVRLDFTRDSTADGTKRTLHCSMVRPPYPTGFRAAAGNGQVRLSWDSLSYSGGDWVEGPEFVVRRACAETARVRPGRWMSYSNAAPFRVVFRGPASVTDFVDRNVENDHLYLYTLTVEGIARATGQLSGGTACSLDLPMAVWYRPGGGAVPILAVPHSPRPVRLAVTSFDRTNVGVAFLRRAISSRLGREPWARLVERTETPSLGKEEQTGQLGTGTSDSDGAGPVRIAADAIVFVTSERIGTKRNLAVWWIDYRDAFSRRILQVPVWNVDLEKTAAQTVARIKKELGSETLRAALSAAAKTPVKPAGKHVVAILGLTPLSLSESKTEIPAKALADLLGVALDSSEHWQTVDREHLAAALSELGTASAFSRNNSMKLGKILGADILLQGWYTTTGKNLALALQPLDVHRGVHYRTVAVSGTLDAPDEVTAEAVRRLERMTLTPDGPPSHPLELALEARTTVFGSNRARTVERRSYLRGSSPEGLLELGNILQASSQVDEALDVYRRGLDMALKQPTFNPYVAPLSEAMDRLLNRLDRTDERIRLWRRVLPYTERRGYAGPVADVHLRLADLLLDSGDKAAANAELLRVGTPPPHSLSRVAAILERLGRTDEALSLYLKADWTIRSGYGRAGGTPRLGPAYAAVIRRLRTARGTNRRRLLAAIVRNLAELHPIQALKAYDELQKAGPAPASLHPDVWRMLKALGRPKQLNRFTESLLDTPPATLEDLRLWNDIAHYYLQHDTPEQAAKFARRVKKSRLKTPAATVQKKLAQKYMNEPKNKRRQPIARHKTTMPEKPIVDDALRSYVTHGGGRQLGLVGKDDLYILTENGFVLRMSPDAGTVRWACSLEYRAPYPRRARTPAERKGILHNLNNAFWLMPDAVYAVNADDGILFAIDIRNGHIRWRYTAWTRISPPIFRYRHAKQVVVANALGELLVFSPADGKLLRRAEGPGTVVDSFADKYVDLQTDYPQERFFVSFNMSGGFAGQRNTETLRDAQSLRMHKQGLMAVFRPRGEYWFQAPDFKVHDIAGASRPPSFASLAKKLRDKSIPDRRQLILIATWRGIDPKVTQALLAICRDTGEPRDLRDQALRALASQLGDAAAPLLIQALASSDHTLQSAAAQEIRSLLWQGRISPDDISALARTARHAAGAARSSLVNALLSLAGHWAKPALNDILTNPKDPLFRIVLTTLAQTGDPDMLEPLEKAGYVKAWFDHPTDQHLCALTLLGVPAAKARVRSRIDMKSLLDTVRRAKTLQQKQAAAIKAKKALGWIWNCLPDPAYLPAIRELADRLRDDKGHCLINNSVRRACVAMNRPEAVPLILRLREEAADRGAAPLPSFGYSLTQPLPVAAGVDFASDVNSWRAWLRRRLDR